MKPLGLILWRGKSKLDGKPVVCVMTGIGRPTTNEKTGDMLQTWILRSRVNPVVAINNGGDESVCGSCPLRGYIDKTTNTNRQRSCYVNVSNAPRAIYMAFRRGSYVNYNPSKHNSLIRGRAIRFGSYGDPCAVSLPVWSNMAQLSDGHTGYSHQWRNPSFWRYRRYLMASCETVADMELAHSKGWRTFRTMPAGQLPIAGEIGCPASEEQGKRLTCATCKACNGAGSTPNRVSISINVHGSPSVLGSYKRLEMV